MGIYFATDIDRINNEYISFFDRLIYFIEYLATNKKVERSESYTELK